MCPRPPSVFASSLELLESRIAPAVFFIGTDSLTVHKGSAPVTPSSAEAAARDLTHATTAVLLSTGDSLVFDADHSLSMTAGDLVLLKVTAGRALVFLTDSGGTTGGFDKTEITGLAVSTLFKGATGTDLNGSVVTALDATGAFTASGSAVALQHASIASLTVDGQIAGNLLAGGAIGQVSAGGQKFNTHATNLSIDGNVATGTAAAAQSVSFDGGSTVFTTTFTVNAGEAGGAITGLTLPNGVRAIHAGDGGDIANGKAGAGGSISGVEIDGSPVGFSILAGAGGKVTTSGTGGAGGSISKSIVYEDTAALDALTFSAGDGGKVVKGAGGAGGGVSGLTVNLLDPAASLTMGSGKGGSVGSSGFGNGGAGGIVSGLNVFPNDLGTFALTAGVGGDGGMIAGLGAAGGGISGSTIDLAAVSGQTTLMAGDGGGGFATGGAGGAIKSLTLGAESDLNSLSVTAGNGGDAAALRGVGGAGGSFATVNLTTSGTVAADLSLTAGVGGDSPTGLTGAGGGITGLTVTAQGAITGALNIVTGAGGSLLQADGLVHHAGSGGAVTHATLSTVALGSFEIATGAGGNVLAGSGSAGASGAIASVTINTSDALGAAGGSVHSGTGGALIGAVGNGGASGAVSAVSINDTALGQNSFQIYAGVPLAVSAGSSMLTMTGIGIAGNGGSIGSMSALHLAAPLAKIVVGRSDPAGQGSGTPESISGSGGGIGGVSGSTGVIDLLAPAGAANVHGHAGVGGSISHVTLTQVGQRVHLIAAGDGGSVSPGGVAGRGGSVSQISVAGDIGDFTKTFGLTTDPAVMGGLVSGQGGSGSGPVVNGSIAAVNVFTHGIAAILSGRPAANGLSYENAVARISGLKAGKLGADTALTGNATEVGNNGGTFDYTEGGADHTFEPDSAGDPLTADTAIDGMVIVRKGGGGATLPVQPLLLIEVA